MLQELTLDGAKMTSLNAFYEQVSQVLVPGAYWGRNLDAFNDILRGGFGTPEEGFVIRWINSDQAREHLGYGETVKRFEEMFWECHPESKDHVYGMLTEARAGKGETVFDQLIEIIRTHGPGGEKADDNVHLALL